jgi:hypothetical protein
VLEDREANLRKRLIEHILNMKKLDVDYARFALKSYHEQLPWLDLMNGVKEALK